MSRSLQMKKKGITYLIVVCLLLLLSNTIISSIYAKREWWKQTSAKNGFGPDFIRFSGDPYALKGPIIKHVNGQTLGLVLFCNRNVLVIYSFAENSMATYMVY